MWFWGGLLRAAQVFGFRGVQGFRLFKGFGYQKSSPESCFRFGFHISQESLSSWRMPVSCQPICISEHWGRAAAVTVSSQLGHALGLVASTRFFVYDCFADTS